MPSPFLPWWISFAVACGAAGGFACTLRWPSPARLVALALLWPIMLVAPVFVADEAPVRMYMAMASSTLAVKMWDLHIGASRGHFPAGWRLASFLISPFSLVERKTHLDARPAPRSIALLAAEGAIMVGGALAGWFLLARCRPQPFAIEHVALVAIGIAAGSGTMDVVFSGWLALGGRGRRLMNRVYLARTPAELWRRWNQPVGQFLFEDVVRPLGGQRRFALGAFAAFALSGAIHEYIADVAVARVQGYQAAFFLLHGVATLATARLDPRGPWLIPAIVATLAFNVASSVLFFASVAEIIPWYSGEHALE